jgi:FMN-dependent NADH-azoreductase
VNRLLHINASPRGEASASLTLASAFLAAYRDRARSVEIDALSLFEDPLPEFGTAASAAKIAAFSGQTPEGEAALAWERARSVFDRFASADAYLFNVPMWNAGVPYVLKQWIDIVTQPGWAFGFHPTDGYTGLLSGKKAVVIYTSGVYAPGVPISFGADFHSTFFNDWLRFVGITDVTEVRFAANAMTATYEDDLERVRQQALAAAEVF